MTNSSNPYFVIMSLKYYYSIKFSMLILSVWFSGVAYIDGVSIDNIELRDLNKEHEKMLEKHRTETMDLLYVDRYDGKWKNPKFTIMEIKNLEEIRLKILSLHTMYEIISKSNHDGTLNNFKITPSHKGIPTIQWDTT